jgi:hypothetical protein
MTERNDTETRSYREEQGKPADADGRQRTDDVPLAPSSAGIVGAPRRRDASSDEADGAADERGSDAVERGEVF